MAVSRRTPIGPAWSRSCNQNRPRAGGKLKGLERPSADAYLEAFGGRFYSVVAPPVVEAMHADWGTYDGTPSSLGLMVALAMRGRHERLAVRNRVSPESATAIVHDLLFRDPTRPFQFPLLVERGRTRIPVDGRERVFTTYTYRGHAIATADVRGLTVTVGCRSRLLPTLRLGTLEPEQLKQLIRDADRFGANLSRRRSPRRG
jgi:hypothetical protein